MLGICKAKHCLVLTIFLLAVLTSAAPEAIQSHPDVNNKWCLNMDYIVRLQHTVDRPNIHKIVAISPLGPSFFDLLYLSDQELIKYQYNPFNKEASAKGTLSSMIKMEERGDLLVLEDVLMYLPNAEIEHLINKVMPTFKYVLVYASVTNLLQTDTQPGVFRPVNVDFSNGRRVLVMNLGEDRVKEAWLIHNS